MYGLLVFTPLRKEAKNIQFEQIYLEKYKIKRLSLQECEFILKLWNAENEEEHKSKRNITVTECSKELIGFLTTMSAHFCVFSVCNFMMKTILVNVNKSN